MNLPTIALNRHRPRFTVRALAIVLTLICVYLGCWEATKRWGLQSTTIVQEESPMPFVVVRYGINCGGMTPADTFPKRYCLWLGGWKVELPIQSSWEDRFETRRVEALRVEALRAKSDGS